MQLVMWPVMAVLWLEAIHAADKITQSTPNVHTLNCSQHPLLTYVRTYVVHGAYVANSGVQLGGCTYKKGTLSLSTLSLLH